MVRFSVLVPLCLACAAAGQTPPIRPQTQEVPVFGPFLLPSRVSQEIGNEPLTADEAVAIAMRIQPSLQSGLHAMRAARARADQSRAALLPQVSLNYTASDVQIVRGSQFAGSQGLGLRSTSAVNVSQLLFDFGQTRAFVRQQSLLARAAEHDYTQAQLDVALAVRRAFYALQRSERLEAVAESNLANRRSQQALADARLTSGLGAPADLVRATNAVAEATIALTTARAATVAARIGLALALGVDPRTPIQLSESSEPRPSDPVEDMILSALEQRPEVKSATAEVSAFQSSVAFARNANSPTFNFVASLSSRGAEDPLINQTSSIGISFSWPVGDGGSAAGRTREARAALEGARARLVSVTQQVAAEVLQANVGVEAALQRLEASRVQVANARELVRISEGRYSGGIGQFLEVTDAQDALFAAERNLATAEADLQTALSDLRRAVGSN